MSYVDIKAWDIFYLSVAPSYDLITVDQNLHRAVARWCNGKKADLYYCGIVRCTLGLATDDLVEKPYIPQKKILL